jgi:hypothetical protein
MGRTLRNRMKNLYVGEISEGESDVQYVRL